MIKIDNKSIYKPHSPSIDKRLAAFLLDFITFLIIFTGILYLLFLIFKFDAHYQIVRQEQINIGYLIFDDDLQKYVKISQDSEKFNTIVDLYINNETLLNEEAIVRQIALNMPLISMFVSLLLVELLMPLIFKNGQTIGMKIFKIVLVSNNNLKVKPVQIFARAVLGKIAVLGEIPLLLVLSSLLGAINPVIGIILAILIAIIHMLLCSLSNNKAGIADKLAQVYPADYSSLIIFDNEEKLNLALNEERKSLESQKKVY